MWKHLCTFISSLAYSTARVCGTVCWSAACLPRWKKAHPDSMANAPRVVAVGADAVDGEAPPDIASFHGSRLYQQVRGAGCTDS